MGFCHVGIASLPSKMNFNFFQSVHFSMSYGYSRLKKHGFKKKFSFHFFCKKIIILEKIVNANATFLWKSHLFVFFIFTFGFWHLACNVTAWKYYISIQEAKTGGWRIAFLHEQWANRTCGLMYRTIFFFTNSCEPELAHRLQTSKMRRNSTSLDSCQHNDTNIVTISVARRRWTAPLKPRRPCVKHFTTFYAPLKHVSPKGDYFTPKGHFFAP